MIRTLRVLALVALLVLPLAVWVVLKQQGLGDEPFRRRRALWAEETRPIRLATFAPSGRRLLAVSRRGEGISLPVRGGKHSAWLPPLVGKGRAVLGLLPFAGARHPAVLFDPDLLVLPGPDQPVHVRVPARASALIGGAGKVAVRVVAADGTIYGYMADGRLLEGPLAGLLDREREPCFAVPPAGPARRTEILLCGARKIVALGGQPLMRLGSLDLTERAPAFARSADGRYLVAALAPTRSALSDLVVVDLRGIDGPRGARVIARALLPLDQRDVLAVGAGPGARDILLVIRPGRLIRWIRRDRPGPSGRKLRPGPSLDLGKAVAQSVLVSPGGERIVVRTRRGHILVLE